MLHTAGDPKHYHSSVVAFQQHITKCNFEYFEYGDFQVFCLPNRWSGQILFYYRLHLVVVSFSAFQKSTKIAEHFNRRILQYSLSKSLVLSNAKNDRLAEEIGTFVLTGVASPRPVKHLVRS
jgi:hypothetical protein